MGKIALERLDEVPVFRKIALGTWRTAKDPSVYGLVEIDMTEALKFADVRSREAGVKITASHLVGKAIAEVLKRRPEINGLIRWGRLYRRRDIDIFYMVNVAGESDAVGGANVSGAVLRKVDTMSITDVARELANRAALVRRNEEPEMRGVYATLKNVPWRLMRWALDTASFLNYDMNWNISWLGVPRDPFGSVMITNVGSLGIETAWAPLVPYTRVPMVLTLGAVHPCARVVDGQVVARPVLKMGITFDHRFLDGSHAGVMADHFKRCFDDPWTHLS